MPRAQPLVDVDVDGIHVMVMALRQMMTAHASCLMPHAPRASCLMRRRTRIASSFAVGAFLELPPSTQSRLATTVLLVLVLRSCRFLFRVHLLQ